MARKGNAYIQFYTAGTAAVKLEPAPPKPKQTKLPEPRVKRRPVLVFRLDPLALCATAVAAVMMLLMAVGIAQLGSAHRQKQVMADYVTQLEAENAALGQTYADGCDLEAVAELAENLGMVPVSQVETVHIQVTLPEPPPPTFWQRIAGFFADLFA